MKQLTAECMKGLKGRGKRSSSELITQWIDKGRIYEIVDWFGATGSEETVIITRCTSCKKLVFYVVSRHNRAFINYANYFEHDNFYSKDCNKKIRVPKKVLRSAIEHIERLPCASICY